MFCSDLRRFQGRKFLKHIFKITIGPKGHPVGQIFGWVLRHHAIWGPRGSHAHFPAKSGPKTKLEILMKIIQSQILQVLKFYQNLLFNCTQQPHHIHINLLKNIPSLI